MENRGGAGRGQGRKPIYNGIAMDVYPIRITSQQARAGRKIGRGNLSLGIRILLEKVIEDLK